MTVEDWALEAVESYGKAGATLREVQRYIDERHFEELAVDTLEDALEQLVTGGRLEHRPPRWYPVKKTSKEDALNKLFGKDTQ